MLTSFPPIVNQDSQVLILGTMPGVMSLTHGKYYAHPQNAFWKIMFHIFGKTFSDKYEDKIQLLINQKVALWDVLQNCERQGSLDSNILCEVPNDFTSFFLVYPHIKHIVFNGQPAYKFFKKHVGFGKQHNFYQMPSTSPAHASKSFSEKLASWSIITDLIH